MQQRASALSTLALTAILIGYGSAAHAAPTTYVSGTGVNTGACPVTAPCATFQYAHNNTDAGGVISVVSTGSFGAVAITKSISIIAADGVQALIRTTTTAGGCAGAAICVAAGATDVVYLRGIIIDLNLANASGINFAFGAALHVQNCVVRRTGNSSPSRGIYLSAQSASALFVSDTTIASAWDGIRVAPLAAVNVKVTLDRVRIENIGAYGILFDSSAQFSSSTAAVIRDSVVSKVALTGIWAVSNTSGGKVDVTVDRTTVFAAQLGVSSFQPGATVRIGNSTITGNVTGLSAQSSAVIALYSTNMTEGNGNDVATALNMRPLRGDRGQ